MAERKIVKAGCLCGNIKIELDLPTSQYPLKGVICHCDSCQYLTGTLCFTAVVMPSDWEPSPSIQQQLHAFPFSRKITQHFCPACGTLVYGSIKVDPDDPNTRSTWDMCAGAFERADGVYKYHRHAYIADTLDGGFSDFFPTHLGHGTDSSDMQVERWPYGYRAKSDSPLPLFWQAANSHPAPASTPKTERLHAHCKCGGVNFWIARPSERSKTAQSPWPDLLDPYYANNTSARSPPAPSEGDEAKWWLRDSGRKFLAGICACNTCRLASGMEWVEWAFVPTVDISLDAEGRLPFTRDFGTLKHFRSSPGVTRHFCGECGASVFWDGDERPTLIDVAVGLLAAEEGARAESWLEWVTDRVSFREDTVDRALSVTESVEAGLKAFTEHRRALA